MSTTPAPLTERELGPFLLWFFCQAGYCDIVETWRATQSTAEPAEPAAPTPE